MVATPRRLTGTLRFLPQLVYARLQLGGGLAHSRVLSFRQREIHIELVKTDNHPTGVGQMGTPLISPAIANAIAKLTGKRLRETPMTPDRVKRALV